MWQLNKIVVPQVMAHWKDVAYNSLHYDFIKVKAIKEKHNDDPKKCCQELFEDWLSTQNEVSLKTWKELIEQLKEVDELTQSIDTIIQKLPSIK